jgi:hypothetical protein
MIDMRIIIILIFSLLFLGCKTSNYSKAKYPIIRKSGVLVSTGESDFYFFETAGIDSSLIESFLKDTSTNVALDLAIFKDNSMIESIKKMMAIVPGDYHKCNVWTKTNQLKWIGCELELLNREIGMTEQWKEYHGKIYTECFFTNPPETNQFSFKFRIPNMIVEAFHKVSK